MASPLTLQKTLWSLQRLAQGQGVLKQSAAMGSSYVVQRRYPVPLSTPDKPPSMRRRHNVYDTVGERDSPFQTREMNVILTSYVEGLGQSGDQVQIKAKTGRELLLTHKAVYPTPENLVKYGKDKTTQTYSSKYVKSTMDQLAKRVIAVTMNKENSWTLEPWHIRVALRKAHFVVPEEAITMPSYPIKGPDMNLEGKEFFVTITINNAEKVVIRCRLHHWATKIEERVPWEPFYFKKEAPLLSEEDRELALQVPAIEPLNMDEDELHDAIAKLKAKAHKTK